MKRSKLLLKLIKKSKIKKIKTGITPVKIFYIWDKTNLTKIETFSI